MLNEQVNFQAICDDLDLIIGQSSRAQVEVLDECFVLVEGSSDGKTTIST